MVSRKRASRPGTPVDDPAWVLVAYPGYVPQIENMITLDDIAYDLALRNMEYNPEIYGPLPTDTLPPASNSVPAKATAQLKGWNKQYYPYFYRYIWPIRAAQMLFNG